MKSNWWWILSVVVVFTACESEVYSPKPFGYKRVDYGEHIYNKTVLPGCSYSFDRGEQTKIELVANDNPCWFNLVYPDMKAKVHFSYFPIEEELEMYVEDARKLAMKHLVKADNYEELYINDTVSNVYGVIYDFSGRSASNMQFYLTDSTQHFVRGALYFEIPPNADSLAPAEKFIEEEIQQLVGSLQWIN
jgi:gliding motility-associated lipoprotein GldD